MCIFHVPYVMCHVSYGMCAMCQVLCVMCHVPCVMCHVSYVMCHVSCVMCHVSCVMCHVSSVMCHVSSVICHVSRAMRLVPCVNQVKWKRRSTYLPTKCACVFRKITTTKISLQRNILACWPNDILLVCITLSEHQFCTPFCSRAVLGLGQWTIKGADVINMYRDRV